MQTIKINCPKCNTEIELTELLTMDIREQLKGEFEKEIKEKEKALSKRESAISSKEQQLKNQEEQIDDLVKKKLDQEKAKLQKAAVKEVQEQLTNEMKDLKNQVEEKNKALEEFRKAELDLRKEMRQLETDRKNLELDITRKLDQERKSIEEQALKRFNEEHTMKDKEKDKIIDDLKKKLDEAKATADRRSGQLIGETQELALEDLLKQNFPMDNITEVPKGVKGADVVQEVLNQQGKLCGKIVWESKRTKTWSRHWIEKLKKDQRTLGAEIAILVTQTFPKDADTFTLINGVYVCSFNIATAVATVLRESLMSISYIKLASEGKSEKIELLYGYLSGSEFHQKVEGIVEGVVMMQKELDKEKRAMNSIWNEREKYIERIVVNTSGMFGDIKGIIGSTLPEIKQLALGPVGKELPPASQE